MKAQEVRARARLKPPAVGKAQHVRCAPGRKSHRLMQRHRALPQNMDRLQKTRRHIVGGKDVQKPLLRKIEYGQPAGVRTAAHDIRRAADIRNFNVRTGCKKVNCGPTLS